MVRMSDETTVVPGNAARLGLERGLYVLSSSGIDGFPTNNRKNDTPFCSLGGISSGVQSIAFDGKGNMLVPDYILRRLPCMGLRQNDRPAAKLSA